jgi:hypothetical protein
MLSLNLHVRQELGEWAISATLVRDLGRGFQPEVSQGVCRLPLTGPEWDEDDLTAVLSAVQRWSVVTMAAPSL